MNLILKIFRYELLRNGRRRGYLFTTFGLPVLVIGVSLLLQVIGENAAQQVPADAETGTETTTVPDETGGGLFASGIEKAGYVDLSGLFTDVELPDYLVVYPDQASGEAALQADEVDAVYVFQPDYAESGNVTVVVPEFNLNNVTSAPIRDLIFRELSADFEGLNLVRLQDPLNLNTINLQRVPVADDAVSNEDTQFVLVYGFGILFFLTIFGTSSYLMQSVIDEKENRLVEILLSSVNARQLLTGKVLAMGVLGLAQVLAWFAIGYGYITLQTLQGQPNPLAGLYIPLDLLPLLVIYFIVGYLMYAAAFGGVGALSNSISEGPQLSIVFGAPIFVTFYLFPLFLSTPNGIVPVLLSLFPLTSPLAMIMRVAITPVPPLEIALSVVLLVLGMLGMFWVAGRMFRVQTLLSGKVPGFRQLPKVIFGR